MIRGGAELATLKVCGDYDTYEGAGHTNGMGSTSIRPQMMTLFLFPSRPAARVSPLPAPIPDTYGRDIHP